MRPRHHTAENRADAGTLAQFADASMRPRHHTAENDRGRDDARAPARASMRPRHHTAENNAKNAYSTAAASLQ